VHLLMREVGDHHEAVLGGKIPDAPVIERHSRGSRPPLRERGE